METEIDGKRSLCSRRESTGKLYSCNTHCQVICTEVTLSGCDDNGSDDD